MGLADRFSGDAPTVAHHNAGCGVGRILTEADPADADVLRAALESPSWRTIDIVDALTDEGFHATSDMVGRHRRGRCKCDEAGLA